MSVMNLDSENAIKDSFNNWLLSFREYENKKKSVIDYSEISDMKSLLENHQSNVRFVRISQCLNDIHQKILEKTVLSLFFNDSSSIKKIVSDLLSQ